MPYPQALLDDLRRRVPVTGGGRLLDLACGPGTVAFALAQDFAEVIALDQEPEFVDLVREKAAQRGMRHLHAVVGTAEAAELAPEFELITIGNAFHRVDRRQVAQRARSLLQPSGCVALLWGSTPGEGGRPWQRAMQDRLQFWMARIGGNRLPTNWNADIEAHPHDTVLRDAGLDYVGKFEFPVSHRWSIDELVGFVYSTSVLSRQALGPEADAFEADLRAVLEQAAPDGDFDDDVSFAYDLARG